MIFDAATTTNGSAGPSWMDAELYRRILCSKNFKDERKVLREVFTRNLLKITLQPLETSPECNQGKATSTIFKEQEEEKKWKYQQRVLDVEKGSFTPLLFGTNGGMGAGCNYFVCLDEKLSEKNEEPYHMTITWIKTLLSFEILRSVHTCRTSFHKIPQGDFIDPTFLPCRVSDRDCRLNASHACVR